eukprot:m.43416 g.43416  ORF g.43416 m.43416 type:complete len:418 (+) comp10773_c0_seq1:345-1598(+)
MVDFVRECTETHSLEQRAQFLRATGLYAKNAIQTSIAQYFAASSPADRIRSLGEVLRVCAPAELRLAGLVVEDLASCLAVETEPFIQPANDAETVLLLLSQQLPEAVVHILYDYIPLLHRHNYPAADSAMAALLAIEFHTNEPPALCHVCEAVFEMCLAHPAFSLKQKRQLIDKIETLTEVRTPLVPRPAATTRPFVRSANIIGIDPATCAFIISLEWSNGTTICIQRTYNQIFAFHSKLLDLFSKGPRVIPFLPGKKYVETITRGKHAVAQSRLPDLQTYLVALFKLDARISQCDHVFSFFSGTVVVSDGPSDEVIAQGLASNPSGLSSAPAPAVASTTLTASVPGSSGSSSSVVSPSPFSPAVPGRSSIQHAFELAPDADSVSGGPDSPAPPLHAPRPLNFAGVPPGAGAGAGAV